jgi:WD40 repeat protein
MQKRGKMKRLFYIITILLFLLSLGCSQTPPLSENQMASNETQKNGNQTTSNYFSPTKNPTDLPTIEPTTTFTPTPTTIPISEPSVKDFVELQTLGRDSLTTYAVSPDGLMIAVAGISGIQTYNTSTMSFENHWSTGKLAQALCWSPDHKFLATTQNDKTLAIWDAASGDMLKKIDLANSNPKAYPEELGSPVSWSPDGTQLFAGGTVWSTKSWKPDFTVKGVRFGVIWSPDNQYISTNYVDGLKAWTRTGVELPDYHGQPYFLVWSPKGHMLAANLANTMSDNLTIWDPITGNLIFKKEFSGYVRDIAWSPDGSKIAVAVADKNIDRIYILNFSSKKIIYTFETLITTNELYIRTIKCIWSLDGDQVITGHDDGFIRIWNKNGKLVNEFQAHVIDVYNLIWLPAQPLKIISLGNLKNSDFGSLRIWSIPDGQMLQNIESRRFFPHLSWSKDSTHIVVGMDGVASNWNVISGHQEQDITNFGNTVNEVDWSVNEDAVAYTKWAIEKVFIWDETHGRRDFLLGQNFSKDIAWSPVKNWLAAAGFVEVSIWDFDSGQVLFHMGNNGHVNCVSWSHDGRLLAYGDIFGKIIIFDTSSKKIIQNISIKDGNISEISWSPDNKSIALSPHYNSRKDQIYNIDTGRLISTFYGGVSISWSPDGNWLATTENDTSLKLLDVRNHEKYYLFTGHEEIIIEIQWSPHGTKVATLGNDGTIRIWGVP